MPLSIKTGAVKVKDSDGDYVDIDLTLSDGYAPLESPAFTGTPTAPTPGVSDDSTKVATTAFVQDVVDSLDAGDIEYSSGATYSNGSTGKAISDLNSSVSSLSGALVPLANGVYCVTAADKNLNNYKTAGNYFFGTDTTNGPGFDWFVLHVEAVDGAPVYVQTATKVDGSIIKRRTSESNWASGWQTVYDKDATVLSIGYTPVFSWGLSATTPTCDNKSFVYNLISGCFLYITGRFRLVTKNTDDQNLSLSFSLPTGYVNASGTVGHVGTVIDTNGATSFAIRTAFNENGCFLAYGAGGGYSMPNLVEGRYYTVNCLVPVRKI